MGAAESGICIENVEIMELDLRDKVVFVAGSSRGIGQSIAQAFLTEGSRVVITGRDADSLAKTESVFDAKYDRERVLVCAGDLTEPSTIADILSHIHDRWGIVECLVVCVGSGAARPGWELNEMDWQIAFEENLWASRRLAEAVVLEMVSAGKGSIVFITSIVGLESVNAPLTYSSAKAALIAYSKNLARQVGAKGVRVNCVAPGNIIFAGGSWEKKLSERPEHFRHYIETEVPLQRFGTPEEIADAALFLSSGRAALITGACVVVDGGQTRGYF